MKSTENFKKVIKNFLIGRCFSDPLFAETYNKSNKNIDDCVTYILNTVKASGCTGFEDNEIFKMAVHYYDEDDIKVGGKIQATIVSNHKVVLTEAEIEEIKKKAKEDLVLKVSNQEKEKIKENAMKEMVEKLKTEFTEQEIAEAKALAIQSVIKEAKDKMTQKPKMTVIKSNDNEPQTLF